MLGTAFPQVQNNNRNKSSQLSKAMSECESTLATTRRDNEMAVSGSSSIGSCSSSHQQQRRQNWMSSLVSSLRSKKSQDKEETAKS